MRINYKINYTGYIPLVRRVLILVKNQTLTLHELGFYICFVMQADYDKEHQNYRAIIRDDKQIATTFNVSSTTVFRYRKRFIEKGLFVEEEGLTKIANFNIFEQSFVNILVKIPYTSINDLFCTLEENYAQIKTFIADMQKKRG